MGYSITDLSANTMKAIFDAAFIDYFFDSDGDLVVKDGGLGVYVTAKPEQDLLKFYTLFAPSPDRSRVLDFCNRFNDTLIMVRASVGNRTRSDGNYMVTFEYDYCMHENEVIEPKKVIWLVRKFVNVTRNGVISIDTDNLF